MNNVASLPRSPELMSRDDTALLVVDVQDKLIPHIQRRAEIVWNIRRLIDGAKILLTAVAATERRPRALGSTVPELAQRLQKISAKLAFSCGACGEIFRDFQRRGIHRVLVVGIEAHVAVQQTVFDLLSEGFRVFVAVDAVGSRRTIDYETALRRMDSAGAALTTTEAALFEWCEKAGGPEFKRISTLAKERPPSEV
jgi:nicotinamidase-related amidase